LKSGTNICAFDFSRRFSESLIRLNESVLLDVLSERVDFFFPRYRQTDGLTDDGSVQARRVVKIGQHVTYWRTRLYRVDQKSGATDS